MLAQTKNQQLKQTIGRMAVVTDLNHSTKIQPRKKQRISVLKRRTYRTEMNTSNKRPRKPQKAVRFDISDKEKRIQNDGMGCTSDNAIDSLNGDDAASRPAAASIASRPRGRIFSSKEIKKLWYDRSDLMGFRKQIYELARFHRSNINDHRNPLPRGMEPLSPIRRKHKADALRYILFAHRTGKDQDYIAWLSANLGQWNKELALRDARLDYFETYEPSFVMCVPPVLSEPPMIPFVPESSIKTDGCSQSKRKNPRFCRLR